MKMAVLPKSIYKFSANLIKISTEYSAEVEGIDLQIHRNKFRNSQNKF